MLVLLASVTLFQIPSPLTWFYWFKPMVTRQLAICILTQENVFIIQGKFFLNGYALDYA